MDPSALRCSVCPNTPRFSDASHLLTHVASKGHLSHYFNWKVRSLEDPDALELVNQYDNWYNQHHLAKALSDRLASKQSRKGKAFEGNAAKNTASINSMEMPQARPAMGMPAINGPDPFSSSEFLDPRLAQSFGGLSNTPIYPNPLAPARYSFPGTEITPVTGRQLSSFTNATSGQNTPLPPYPHFWKPASDLRGEHDFKSSYSAPMLSYNPPQGRSERCTTVDESDPFTNVQKEDIAAGVELQLHQKVDEMTRLKGVFWPGMDIFDSATDVMRRQRNQKKDATMLQMMEQASQGITPTELVFSPFGTLRRCRLISGKVEDSSPLKGETPIPKRRVQRSRRKPLAPSDSNQLFTPSKNRGPSKRDLISTSPLADLPRRKLFRSENASSVRPATTLGQFHIPASSGNSGRILARSVAALHPRTQNMPVQPKRGKVLTTGKKTKNLEASDLTSDDKENINPEFFAQSGLDPSEPADAYWDQIVRENQRIHSSLPVHGNSYYSAGFASAEPGFNGFGRNPLWASRHLGQGLDQELFVGHEGDTDFQSRTTHSPNATISDVEHDDCLHQCAQNLSG